MATLNSPGVSVEVINESFYTPAAPGTIPLIFVASASNKSNSSGTGTAAGTLESNAGKVWTITSQRDLADTFGTPYFETDSSNNPVNGGELNEYGLQAAYSLLGVSSQAYITRADVDLSQLIPEIDPPGGLPVSGTYWVDTSNTLYGVSEWDATNKVFVNVTPLIIDDSNASTAANLVDMEYEPKSSFGTVGSYVMVVTSQDTNTLWYKNSDNVWVRVGSNYETNFQTTNSFTSTAWQTSYPVVTGGTFASPANGDSFTINNVPVTLGATVTPAGVAATINSAMSSHGVNARVLSTGVLALVADASAKSNGTTSDGGITLTDTTVGKLAKVGLTAGTYGAVALAVQPHTQVPRFSANKNASGSVYIKTTAPNVGANWSVKYYNGSTQNWGNVSAPIYASSDAAIYALDKAGGNKIPVGTLYIESNFEHGTGATTSTQKLAQFAVLRRAAVSPTTVSYSLPTVWTNFASGGTFQVSETLPNTTGFYNTATVTLLSNATLDNFVSLVSAAGLSYVSANYDNNSRVVSLSHSLGGDFKLLDGTSSPLTGGGSTKLGFSAYNMSTKTGTANLYATGMYEADGFTLRASNWKPLVYEAKTSAPMTTPADGQLWFSPTVDEVDILYHNGTTWVGYHDGTAFPNTNPNGPIIAATAPPQTGGQSDGTDLVNGDIWISTADIDNYGKNVYVWNGDSLKWILQDTTDHVTTNGWLFADARWATSGSSADAASIKSLLSSNYLDPDAPDPALYPEGTRLWNTRRSGYNVKKYVQNYINIYSNNGVNPRYNSDSMASYKVNRWVTASPNDDFGVGSFGRHAQRAIVVARLKEVVDTNTAIRDTDRLVFNLIACPGYPELTQNMIAFNNDRRQTAFVVADTPFRLPANGTSLSEWGTNVNGALDNNEVGAVSYDNYMAMYYPSGYTNDNLGNYIVVPPSHMALRTIARSDSVSYPWFAPAGLRRGTVDNATAVGYVDSVTGEFVQASLYESLRDVMAKNGHINPIATLPGSGLTVMGEYTRANAASALDRIGVARLVCYLRRQLEILSRPFLFEPNDKITRDEIKAAAESLLLELVGQRALYDFIVVCDESNNTSARIDRNELWMDIAIEPVKAVEFIYIPLRLVNTGAIKAGKI
jgi:hypothetical protein